MTNQQRLPCTGPLPAPKLPAPELIAVLEALRPGTALDLAAGSGRHARWLAERGWKVTAADMNLPEGRPAAITWLQVNLEKEWVPFAGDLVVCWLYWQPDLLPRIAAALKPGAVAALAGKTSGRFATSLEAYRKSFSGWSELSAGQDEVKTWFIARKPT